MSESLFAPDFSDEPFWWARTPRPALPASALPERADVLVIGSGYTGLNAAIQTARGGRHTVVIDAEAAGWGCSTRNGGQISTSIKPDYHTLRSRHGSDAAFAIRREGHEALEWIGEFIHEEGIDCEFRRCGRFYAAHTPGSFERLARSLDTPRPGLESGSYLVPRDQQHTEIDSPLYHGGVVHPRHARRDPGRYHQALLDLALAAGVQVIPCCRATAIHGGDGAKVVTTEKGTIETRDVVAATNGYTTSLTPWLRRRAIPIGSYMIATEELDEALVRRLIPNDRVITDTRKLVVYYRTCPRRRRILFGARVSVSETDPRAAAPALHGQMTRRFPQLADARISHSWMGFVAYTFDEMPHLGKHEGVHYAMGYCGSGVSLASYLGRKVGQQILGSADGDSPLTRLRFQSRPYYWGRPWFLAPAVRYYRWQDERAG